MNNKRIRRKKFQEISNATEKVLTKAECTPYHCDMSHGQAFNQQFWKHIELIDEPKTEELLVVSQTRAPEA